MLIEPAISCENVDTNKWRVHYLRWNGNAMPIKNAKTLIRQRLFLLILTFYGRAHPGARFLSWIGRNEKRIVTRVVNTTRPLRPCEQQAVNVRNPRKQSVYATRYRPHAEKKKIHSDVSRMRKPRGATQSKGSTWKSNDSDFCAVKTLIIQL